MKTGVKVAPKHSKRVGRERGAAAVEFALILPIMLLVIGGIVDFGRALFTEIELANAAREGARAASISGATLPQVQARVTASTPALTVTAAAVLCDGVATQASVTASSSFDWILLRPAMSLFGGGGTLPGSLTSTAVMKCGG